MAKKKDLTAFYIGGFIAMVLIISVCVFLFTKDGYNGQEITGLEAIKRSNPGLITWGIAGLIVGSGLVYLSYANATGEGIGAKLPGKEWVTIALLAIGLLLICGPWGKACSDKANGGYTLPTKTAQP